MLTFRGPSLLTQYGREAHAVTPQQLAGGPAGSQVGGVLTHAAVVAREFGIPAVVGTRRGTAAIPDGALVTVDGAAGTVTIEP